MYIVKMVYSSETIYIPKILFCSTRVVLTLFAGIYVQMCHGATSCLDGPMALSKLQLRTFSGSRVKLVAISKDLEYEDHRN
jgi:hypothetical protein